MGTYMTGFSLPYDFQHQCEDLALVSNIVLSTGIELRDEDDNRGSGR